MTELDRIRREYARRAQDPHLQDRYSISQPDVQFALHTRERAVLRLLHQTGLSPERRDVLEVGCGEGDVLLELLRWGADPARLCGCDLLSERLVVARRRLPPAVSLAVADGGALPYPSAAFDLVAQFTVLTSVLDDNLRKSIAQEMWRVLRPGGAVLWYDFHFQGFNRAVRAIGWREVRALFPHGNLIRRTVTLAMPITRHLAHRSWLACELLERLPWLRTHDLILIRKPGEKDERG